MEPSLMSAEPGRWPANVIAFCRPANAEARLTMRDRMEVIEWRERARTLGFDRLVVHERGSFDPPDVDSYLSVYRRGTNWARWGCVRRGAHVDAWCAQTGADVGRFGSVSDALRALLATA